MMHLVCNNGVVLADIHEITSFFIPFHFHRTEEECDRTSGLSQLKTQHVSLWDQNFYDCFKHGLN